MNPLAAIAISLWLLIVATNALGVAWMVKDLLASIGPNAPAPAIQDYPGCIRAYLVAPGDTCYTISVQHGITADHLWVISPQMRDNFCDNLQPGERVCVEFKSPFVPPPPPPAPAPPPPPPSAETKQPDPTPASKPETTPVPTLPPREEWKLPFTYYADCGGPHFPDKLCKFVVANRDGPGFSYIQPIDNW